MKEDKKSERMLRNILRQWKKEEAKGKSYAFLMSFILSIKCFYWITLYSITRKNRYYHAWNAADSDRFSYRMLIKDYTIDIK